LQRRRHDQLLAEFEMKLLFKCHGSTAGPSLLSLD
jgi:hypothetical protein